MKELNQQNRKLGRGLSALMGEGNIKRAENLNKVDDLSKGEIIQNIVLEKIVAGIYQPRRLFDDQEIQELANSIREKGVIQPIVLRKNDENLYEIIAGERRFRASKISGAKTIPAIIKNVSNIEALELALIENIQRSDLSLIEEANGYKQLINEFSYSQEEIAKRVSKSRSHITNLLRLLSLPNSVKEFLDKKLISMGHARAIINSENPEELAQKIIDLSLTVRATEEIVRHEKEEQKSKSTPAFFGNENGVKYINSDLLQKIEDELETYCDMTTKISYNSKRKKGKITMEFEEISQIQELINKLKQASN